MVLHHKMKNHFFSFANKPLIFTGYLEWLLLALFGVVWRKKSSRPCNFLVRTLYRSKKSEWLYSIDFLFLIGVR